MLIRSATPADARAMLDIYAPYVRSTAITFEYDVPGLDEFTGRVTHTTARYPWLLAEEDGRALGYAYAGPLKGRAAYDWSCETTIYLDPAAQGRGVARRLYEALEAELRARGLTNMYACIAWPEVEDEYLTGNSVRFHGHMGFVEVAHFHQCGCKFGRWYDMIWMEKMIGPHDTAPRPPFEAGK